ncbi:MAG: hypothetical protein K2X29_01190 [Candidatus Obscuribacterales bacterium]|nr:hypothetical protein [Candidatus Obscuribacterales bacterium]
MSDAVSPMNEAMKYQIGEANYKLDQEAVAVFVNCFDHPNIVKTSLGFVHCKKNTAMFVFDRDRDVAIYVLESNSKDDVRVLMGDHFFNLRSGQQLLLSKDKTLAFNDINPVPNIGYRAAKDKGVIEDTKVFLADFSIPSALISVKPLRQALTKPKTSADKRLGHALLKNASILSAIGDADGPYKYSPVPNNH